MFANLADLAHCAHHALVLAVVLGPVERTLLVRRTAVNRGVASRADLEFCELVKFDLYCIVWVALALGLGLSCLQLALVTDYDAVVNRIALTDSKILLAPPLARIRLAKLKAEL